MPDSPDVLKNLADSKAKLADVSKIAEGVKSGVLPAADALKIPEQVAAAQGMLGDLKGSPDLEAAKGALDKAMGAADGLKEELAQKLPPVVTSQDALKAFGQEVAAAGEPLKAMATTLPPMKLPLGEASADLGALKKKVPSAATVKEKVPKVQDKIAPLKSKVPDVASQLDPPKKIIEGLSGKLTDVLGGVKPLLDKPPLSMALKKAKTGDKVKEELAAAEAKLPTVPPLIDAVKAKIQEALAPLLEADKKLAELQAAAVAIAPPPPNAELINLKDQIGNTASAVAEATNPVMTAAANIPAAQKMVEQAQALSAKASKDMKPEELVQTMTQIVQLVGEAQKQLAGPLAGMPDAEIVAAMQQALAAIADAAATTLPAAAAAAPAEQQVRAAELLNHADTALQPAPGQMAEAAPAIQQLADLLPKLTAPLAQTLQAMNDALTPEQQDLAEIERALVQAESQMADQQQQADSAAKQIDEMKTKVDGAIVIEDADKMKVALDDITAGLPQLDDKPISDIEKRLPELEALLARVEASDGGAA
jgi:chromosome segregation ATPase